MKKIQNNQIYITKIYKKEDVEYAGPEISASSWEDAEKQALAQGVILVGKLDD